MRIDRIEIKNYRLFKDISVDLDPHVNMIIGNNGSGKSSLLNALLVGASSFLSGIAWTNPRGILTDDVRHEIRTEGGLAHRVDCYPVGIKCYGYVNEYPCVWERGLNGPKSKTTNSGIKDIRMISKGMEQDVIDGNEVVLPLIAYYGTGRLWAQKKTKREGVQRLQSRFRGYEDCIDEMASDKQLKEWFYDLSVQEEQEGKIIQLRTVQKAMEKCFADMVYHNETGNVKIRFRQKYKEIVVEYDNENGEREIHPISEMSDGYKTTLNMIADIAHRMAVLNPGMGSKILETPGIVIIDELELHLHPGWQARIIKDLAEVFPKIQFIVSTHSPEVISSYKDARLILLKDKQQHHVRSAYGKDVNTVLQSIFDVSDRDEAVALMLLRFARELEENDAEAEKILNNLEETLGKDDPAVYEAHLDLDIKRMNVE